jgi:DNA-binding beta-propeller fold protein YncE
MMSDRYKGNRMLKVSPATVLMAALAGCLCAVTGPTPRAGVTTGHYQFTNSIPLGAPERWDYLSFDPASNRVFAAHGDRIDVLDLSTHQVVGQVPVNGANGSAIVSSIGKGYAGSRGAGSVVVFDLKTFKVLKTVQAGEDTDAIVHDPASRRVFVMLGGPHAITVIDTDTDTVSLTIHLDGQPEFAAVDGAGKLYVNIEDKSEIQRIDTKSGDIDATWPIKVCDSPHGLAIDAERQRLFVSCVNSKLLVVNALNGVIVSTLPIGKYTDAAAYDRVAKRVFSSNGDGTLSIFEQESADQYRALGQVATPLGARTMALDAESGRIFLITGDNSEVDPSAKDLRKRYAVKPGSVRLLQLDFVSLR